MPRTKRSDPETWNRSRGVSLPPEQWNRIEAIAVGRNVAIAEVMGEAVTLFLSVHANSGNTRRSSGKTQSDEETVEFE
jgi:hypothetical protein